MIARDLMTPDPVTVTPQVSLAEVWDLMREVDVRHVPVVQGAALVGMVSDRDLARVDIARLLQVEGAGAVRDELAAPIVRVMSPNVIAVGPETEIGDVDRSPARPQGRSGSGGAGGDPRSARDHQLRGSAAGPAGRFQRGLKGLPGPLDWKAAKS